MSFEKVGARGHRGWVTRSRRTQVTFPGRHCRLAAVTALGSLSSVALSSVAALGW